MKPFLDQKPHMSIITGPHLISKTSCLLSSNFLFQSLLSTSLVIIWEKKKKKKSPDCQLPEAKGGKH